MTAPLHPQLLSAFLDGKSCATIARTFSLSIEEVLAWFESELTQSTLRRLESLQLQQARIVSFSVLPAATGSLSRTSTSAPDPILQTRAASNLVRLGLRFTAPSRNSGAPSPMGARVGGRFNSPADLTDQTSRTGETLSPMGPMPDTEFDPLPDEFPPDGFEALTNETLTDEAVFDEDEFHGTNAPQFDDPEADFSPLADTANEAHSYNASDPFVPSDSSDSSVPSSPPTRRPRKLACETLRAEFAALRTGSPNALRSSSRIRASNQTPDRAPTLNPLPAFVTPLLSRRESRIASLRSSAGAIASHDAFPALNRAPPRNSHAPPPRNSAA